MAAIKPQHPVNDKGGTANQTGRQTAATPHKALRTRVSTQKAGFYFSRPYNARLAAATALRHLVHRFLTYLSCAFKSHLSKASTVLFCGFSG
ncbi:MAG: hypothetical protein U1C96_11165 [Gallionella sp.]|nr:hypothetical protein [Gallionella sp.]